VKKSGFVLITLLILLLILSLLAVHAMNNSLLQTRMSHNFFVGFQRINDADRVLLRAEVDIERHNNWRCKLNPTAADYVLHIKNKQGLSSLASCRTPLSENREGHYVIQVIPDEEGKVCIDEKQSDKAVYYRITSWVRAYNKEGILLQSTYAKLQGKRVQKTCTELPQIPKSTRLSWRVLS
jgi:Tfp pilus assembly protein PilE